MCNTIYIVTGAAGHLGSHVVRELLSQGFEVRALVLPDESCPRFVDINRHLLKEYAGNVCDPASLAPLFEGHSPGRFTVIHCAGIVTITDKEDKRVYDVNVNGTANIIGACTRYAVKRLVYISSVHAISMLPRGHVMREIDSFNPDAVPGFYDKTKAIATQLVLDAAKTGLDAVVVHPAGIIGPNGLPTGNMAHLIMTFLRGRLPAAFRGGFDFVDVRDVACGIVAAAEKGESGKCYILSNRFIKLQELFDILSEISGRKKLKLYVPVWVVKAVAPLAELYYRAARKTPILTRFSLRTVSGNGLYSHERADKELGYRTRPLKETLADTVVWIKETSRRKPHGRLTDFL